MIKRLISGGQTGVDRAALDVGLTRGIPIGGACPRGRLAEDGPIPLQYPLEELDSADYSVRTRKNVTDGDGTLIIYLQPLSGGTALTKTFAEKLHKPYLLVDLACPPQTKTIRDWLQKEHIDTLNIAGPRESNHPGIYQRAFSFLAELFFQLDTRTYP